MTELINDVFASFAHRIRALREGVLFDVSFAAKQFEIPYPVTIHKHVWALYVATSGSTESQRIGRIESILEGAETVFASSVLGTSGIECAHFPANMTREQGDRTLLSLALIVEHWADASGFISVILPEDWPFGQLGLRRHDYRPFTSSTLQ